MSRDAKIQMLLAIQERDRRKRAGPLLYHEPHPGQKRADDSMGEKRVVVVLTGNRWGKSHWNAAWQLACMYGYRIWDVPNLTLTDEGDYPPRSEVPAEYWIRNAEGVPLPLPNKGVAVTGLGFLQGIGGVLWPKIEDLLPTAIRAHPDLVVRRGTYGVPVLMQLPTSGSTGGSTVMFGSGEQSPMQYEGKDNDWAAFDEPPPRPIWQAVWRGLTDRSGIAWLTTTPIGPNAPWVHDEFEAKGRTDSIIIRGSIWENPFIADTAKQEFIEGGGFLEEEKAARETGAWTFLTHRAFPQFDPAAHVIPPQKPPAAWKRLLAIDPAHRRPWALLWVAFGPGGEVMIYDEWPAESHHEMRSSVLTIDDYLKIIIEKEGMYRADFRVLDPRFGQAQGTLKGERYTSVQEDFAERGMYFDCRLEGTEREEIGIDRVRQLLRFDRSSPLSQLNRPRLQVCSNCINAIASLHLSNFVPPQLKSPDVLPEKTQEVYKDFRDCIRYAVLYPVILDFDGDFMGYIDPKELEKENYPDEDDWW